MNRQYVVYKSVYVTWIVKGGPFLSFGSSTFLMAGNVYTIRGKRNGKTEEFNVFINCRRCSPSGYRYNATLKSAIKKGSPMWYEEENEIFRV